MKTTIVILVSLIMVSSSCKKRTKEKVIVIKGCEGTYLRLNDKDYTICNEEKLDKFENGASIEAEFIKDNDCISNRVHCMMLHGYETAEGIYRITKIK